MFSVRADAPALRWIRRTLNLSLPRPANPRKAGKSVTVFAPGFAADCLETLEELAIRGRQQFAGAGGGNFAYLPCLNADAPGMTMIETLVRRELAGWLA